MFVSALTLLFSPLAGGTMRAAAKDVEPIAVVSVASVDGILRDVRTLTEAAQSLGGGWGVILFRVILPNIRVAILSGMFLSFAIVMGEMILAQYLVKPAFAPYMAYLMQQKAYEPAALAVISFALTWASMGIIQFVGRGVPGQTQVAAGH